MRDKSIFDVCKGDLNKLFAWQFRKVLTSKYFRNKPRNRTPEIFPCFSLLCSLKLHDQNQPLPNRPISLDWTLPSFYPSTNQKIHSHPGAEKYSLTSLDLKVPSHSEGYNRSEHVKVQSRHDIICDKRFYLILK